MKHQLTQPGYDGTFTWSVGVPSPTDVSDDVSQLGSFPAPAFGGFNNPGEKGGNGPSQGASVTQPTSGYFPGDGTDFAGFGGPHE